MNRRARVIVMLGALLFQPPSAGAQEKPPATPSPLTASPPAWTATSHAHYLAAAYGRTESHIALYAPGHTTPSAVLTFNGCCAIGAGFDGSGNLFVATTLDGLMLIPPGATKPTRRIAAAKGGPIAVDGTGDVAVAGVLADKMIRVYPGGVEANGYVIPAHATIGGIAFAPNGDLAVADADTSAVTIYAKGAMNATRRVAVPLGTNLVTYDPDGHLVAASTRNATVTRSNPAAASSTLTSRVSSHWRSRTTRRAGSCSARSTASVRSTGTSTPIARCPVRRRWRSRPTATASSPPPTSSAAVSSSTTATRAPSSSASKTCAA